MRKIVNDATATRERKVHLIVADDVMTFARQFLCQTLILLSFSVFIS